MVNSIWLIDGSLPLEGKVAKLQVLTDEVVYKTP